MVLLVLPYPDPHGEFPSIHFGSFAAMQAHTIKARTARGIIACKKTSVAY